MSILTIKAARAETSGDISNRNTKMNGTTLGLSTDFCDVGGELSKIVGSVCHRCYAKRGSGCYPNVAEGRRRNTIAVLNGIAKDKLKSWTEAMVFLIKIRSKLGFHRWHDSGDLQGPIHYRAIINIARELPDISFWLPTKEKKLVSRYKGVLPDNLCVRLSGAMVDGLPPVVGRGITTSTVHKEGTGYGFVCPAPVQGGACLDCIACYNKNVSNVSYHKH